jgi:hypothetical protein
MSEELQPKEMTGADVDELVAALKDCPEDTSFGHYCATAMRVAPEYSASVVVMALVYSYGYADYAEFKGKVTFAALKQMIPQMVEKNADFFANLQPVKMNGTEEASPSKTGEEAGQAASAS